MLLKKSIAILVTGLICNYGFAAESNKVTWPNGLDVSPIKLSNTADPDTVKILSKTDYDQIYVDNVLNRGPLASDTKTKDPIDLAKVSAALFGTDLVLKAKGSPFATSLPRGFAVTGLITNLLIKDKDVQIADQIRDNYEFVTKPSVVGIKVVDVDEAADIDSQLVRLARQGVDFFEKKASGVDCPLSEVNKSLFGVAYTKNLKMYLTPEVGAIAVVNNCNKNDNLSVLSSTAFLLRPEDRLYDPKKRKIIVKFAFGRLDKYKNTGELGELPVSTVLGRLSPDIGREWIVLATPDQGGSRVIIHNKTVYEYPLPEDPFAKD